MALGRIRTTRSIELLRSPSLNLCLSLQLSLSCSSRYPPKKMNTRLWLKRLLLEHSHDPLAQVTESLGPVTAYPLQLVLASFPRPALILRAVETLVVESANAVVFVVNHPFRFFQIKMCPAFLGQQQTQIFSSGTTFTVNSFFFPNASAGSK